MWRSSALVSFIVFVTSFTPKVQAGTVDRNKPTLAKDVASPVELEQREKRLQNGPVVKLYHQTAMDACKAIMTSRFYVGKSGIAGGGIYWAEKAFHTQWKAEKNGCMIEAWVALGRQEKLAFQGDRSITSAKMLRAGYDSVWIPRGCRGPPCTNAPTPEIVIYFSDQILQMTAYPCKKDGTRTGAFFSNKEGIAGPLSEKAPKFIHSEGIWGDGVVRASPYTGFTVQYATIGDVPSSEDLCPACPMCKEHSQAYEATSLATELSGSRTSASSIIWIAIGMGMISVGAVLLLSGRHLAEDRGMKPVTSWTDAESAEEGYL